MTKTAITTRQARRSRGAAKSIGREMSAQTPYVQFGAFRALPPYRPAWLETATWAFLVLGVAIRLVRYGACFPLWGDEYLLASNFLDRGFAGLLEPLARHQVAPVSFLWIELAATRLFGFSEWSLRLFPLVCGLAALVLFRSIAVRTFDRLTALLAVGIFATSHYIVRYNAEVKPYGIDLLMSLTLLGIALAWWRSPGQVRWLWCLAIAAPVALLMSYPAMFVIGGLSMALLPGVWRQSAWRYWLPYFVLNLLAALGFLLLLKIAVGPQFAAEREVMRSYWANAFPPLHGGRQLLLWLLDTHTGEMFAYPLGAETGGGALQFIMFVVGLGYLISGGHRPLGIATIAIFGLALVAAGVQRYPYGGHPRLMQYAAPLICLIMAQGITCTVDSMRHDWVRKLTLGVAFLTFVGSGTAVIAYDCIHPYRDEHERVYRDAARWFWKEQNRRPGEIVCVDTDLGHEFYPTASAQMSWLAYRCNQRIYSVRHRRGQVTPNQERVSSQWPLRCVVYHQADAQRDDARFNEWLTAMKSRFDLKSTAAYRWNEQVPQAAEVYDVYEFAPKPPGG